MGDESHLEQYLTTMIRMLAEQRALIANTLLEHTQLVNALTAKLNRYELENLTLRNQLRQLIATNQDLLALRNPP